jgi:hypothetical protein
MNKPSKQLPSWIKPDSADAFNHAYTMLYCEAEKTVRQMLDRVKDGYVMSDSDLSYDARYAREFYKEVQRIAQYAPSFEDMKALERREKVEGLHPSQQKKALEVKTSEVKPAPNNQIPPSSENPS